MKKHQLPCEIFLVPSTPTSGSRLKFGSLKHVDSVTVTVAFFHWKDVPVLLFVSFQDSVGGFCGHGAGKNLVGQFTSFAFRHFSGDRAFMSSVIQGAYKNVHRDGSSIQTNFLLFHLLHLLHRFFITAHRCATTLLFKSSLYCSPRERSDQLVV